MTTELQHRGPDGEGIALAHNVALGHRRLSIIDLTLGTQPMWSADGRYVISFNGEIFNYLEVRRALQQDGVHFRTSSDTEVLLYYLIHRGPAALGALNGQFAFALYDTHERRLILGRDRMGEKPLYIGRIDQALVFASEVKAIVRYARATHAALHFDAESLYHFLSLNYVPFGKTFLQGVESLPPGHYMVVTEQGVHVTVQPFAHAVERCGEHTAADFPELLMQASALRLRSDVPVGLYLSSGLDSTSVAVAIVNGAQKAGLSDAGITAYIADFHEPSFGEAPEAIDTCRHLGLPYQVVDIAPDEQRLLTLLDQLVYHGDQPLADSSAIPVYLLSERVAQEVKVVLSGDGGDELFAGYLTYQATLLAARLPAWLWRLLFHCRALAHCLPLSEHKVGFGEKLERFLRNANLPPGAAHFAWNGMFQAAAKVRLLHPDVRRALCASDTFRRMAETYGVDLMAPSLSALLHADQQSYLVDDILAKTDRMSMAHGLEVRPVFMDPALIDFAHRLPGEQLLTRGTGKKPLRQFLAHHAPWYPQARPKRGFSVPIHHWFRTTLRETMDSLLHDESAGAADLFCLPELRRRWHQHLARRANLGFELWGVLVALLWYRRFCQA
jgi:asparagine synthase (glutamine-hydrolysing)